MWIRNSFGGINTLESLNCNPVVKLAVSKEVAEGYTSAMSHMRLLNDWYSFQPYSIERFLCDSFLSFYAAVKNGGRVVRGKFYVISSLVGPSFSFYLRIEDNRHQIFSG